MIGCATMGRMSAALENSAGPEDQAVANDYDSFAEAYAAETESNLINGYYVRPAVLDLACLRICLFPKVGERRLLDFFKKGVLIRREAVQGRIERK